MNYTFSASRECKQIIGTAISEHDTLLLSRLQLFGNVDMGNAALRDLLQKRHYRHIIGKRFRDHVSKAGPDMDDGKPLPRVMISLGVARRYQQSTPDMMIAAADVAIYQAKPNGKNRIKVPAEEVIEH